MSVRAAVWRSPPTDGTCEERRLTLTIILDLIRVIHYLWIGAYVLCNKDTASTEARVRELLGRLLTGPANYVAASLRRQATMMNLTAAEREQHISTD